MLRTTRKIFSVIEKNKLTNVQVLVNMEIEEIVVTFNSVKDYKIFVKQYEHKFSMKGIAIERSNQLIWRK